MKTSTQAKQAGGKPASGRSFAPAASLLLILLIVVSSLIILPL